jgi:hypothetical protein
MPAEAGRTSFFPVATHPLPIEGIYFLLFFIWRARLPRPGAFPPASRQTGISLNTIQSFFPFSSAV